MRGRPLGSICPSPLSRRGDVLSLLQAQPQLNNREVAERLGMAADTVSGWRSKFEAEGLIDDYRKKVEFSLSSIEDRINAIVARNSGRDVVRYAPLTSGTHKGTRL